VLTCVGMQRQHVSDVIKGQHRSSVVAASVLVTALNLMHNVSLLLLGILGGWEGAGATGHSMGCRGSLCW
jgi:hypothetical protein